MKTVLIAGLLLLVGCQPAEFDKAAFESISPAKRDLAGACLLASDDFTSAASGRNMEKQINKAKALIQVNNMSPEDCAALILEVKELSTK